MPINKTLPYFYKLGHCQPLAMAEFASLSGDSQFEANNDFLLSTKSIPIQTTGSLIFTGEVLARISSQDFLKNNPLQKTQGIFNSKKLGISILTKKSLDNNLILKDLKSQGYKKINLLKNKTPTIGNFLGTRNWLILFDFQEDLILAKITDFFDQEFWSELDMKLPIRDLKRGQTNLKLARSMLNLTTKTSIWDPFCGIARNLIAGIDLKTDLVASDIDKVAVSQAKQNYKFAQDFFSQKDLKTPTNKPLFFNKDATKSFVKLDLKLPSTVVTEGYLGKTFRVKPKLAEIEQELEKVRDIWAGALLNFKELEIQEIILCLPFYIYEKKLILPEFIYTLASIFNYKIVELNPLQKKVLYKRKNSHTGHWVVKLQTKYTLSTFKNSPTPLKGSLK